MWKPVFDRHWHQPKRQPRACNKQKFSVIKYTIERIISLALQSVWCSYYTHTADDAVTTYIHNIINNNHTHTLTLLAVYTFRIYLFVKRQQYICGKCLPFPRYIKQNNCHLNCIQQVLHPTCPAKKYATNLLSFTKI